MLYNISSQLPIQGLEYADDMALISDSMELLEKLMQAMETSSSAMGLTKEDQDLCCPLRWQAFLTTKGCTAKTISIFKHLDCNLDGYPLIF